MSIQPQLSRRMGLFAALISLSAATTDAGGDRVTSRFSQAGAQVELRSRAGEGQTWTLRAVSAGRVGSEAILATSHLREIAGGADLHHGWLVERFRPTGSGFDYHVDLAQRPEGEGRLALTLVTTSDFCAGVRESADAVDYRPSGGGPAAFRFGPLLVRDALGTALDAKLETAPRGLRLLVDDRGATYPIAIDGVATTASWSKSGELAGHNYGWDVSSIGDVNGDGYDDILVGAPDAGAGQQGKVYLYYGGPGGPGLSAGWSLLGSGAGHRLGFAVSAAGDLNGDGYADFALGAIGAGYVYIYLGGPSGPAATPQLLLPGTIADQYGFALAPAGDVNGDGYGDLLIGAPSAGGVGQAYLYPGSASGLVGAPSTTYTGTFAGGLFGYSVAATDFNADGLADVVIGAPVANGDGQVTVYPSGCGGCSSVRDGLAAGGQYGISVAPAGDIDGDGDSEVLVGANLAGGGRVDMLKGSPGGLGFTNYLIANSFNPGDNLGIDTMSAGDVNGDGYADILVGALTNGSGNGYANLYLGGPGLTTPGTTAWSHADPIVGSNFGRTVSAGDTNGDGLTDLIVGAYATPAGGTVEVYFGAGDPPHYQPTWSPVGEHAGSSFGSRMALVGDVNGDGHDDAVVGAVGYAATSVCSPSTQGKAYLYFGQPLGLSGTSTWSVSGGIGGNGCRLASALSGAGDVDGDGYADILLGADAGAGQALLFRGSPSGPSSVPAWSFAGESPSDALGRSLAGVGDVNGDGYSDIVVAAPARDSSRGRVYLFLGGNGPGSVPDAIADGEAVGDRFGSWVAGAGDVNRDGYADVVIGASGRNADLGRVYLYFGTPSGWVAGGWTADGQWLGDRFGDLVAGPGDVNGDGYADILVAAPGSLSGSGIVFLFLGGASGPAPTPTWQFGGVDSLAAAGDVNHDGYQDFAIGTFGGISGSVDVWLGGSGGPIGGAGFSGMDTDKLFVAGGGDVDADGAADLIVGDPDGNPAVQAYLYLGNGGASYLLGPAGLTTKPRQQRFDLSASIGPQGNAAGGLLRLAMTARPPHGRGRVKLESQVAPLGGDFGSPKFSSAWNDSGTAGVPLDLLTELVGADGPYRWRLRTRYSPLTSPYQSHGPWYAPVGNGPRETDVRRIAACTAPISPASIPRVTRSSPEGLPILTLKSTDPAYSRTGYNLRRSSDASLAKSSWNVLGSNVADMDGSTLAFEWTDQAGADVSPTSIWFYQATTYQSVCAAEGPF